MNIKTLLLFILASFFVSGNALAGDKKTIQQQVSPTGFDNYSFSVFFHHADEIFNLKGKRLFSGDIVDDLKQNPAGIAIISLEHNKKGKHRAAIYDINPRHILTDRMERAVKVKDAEPTAVAYSADARRLAVSFTNKQINFYDAIGDKLNGTFTSQFIPTKLTFSDNNYFLGAAKDNQLEIWNLDKGIVRTTLKTDSGIKDFCFSNNSANLMVMTEGGKLYVYDTKTFEVAYTIEDLGQPLTCAPNSTGKYVAVVNNDKLISVINILDPTERHMITDEDGGIAKATMIYHESKDSHYLVYNSKKGIIFQEVKGLTPYYNKMMTTQLNEQLNQWMKQRPDESMADYQLRVNDSTRLEQARAIEREIATKMATGLLEQSEVTVGNYNPTTHSLALKINSMPDIFIGVPLDEVTAFNNASTLKFSHAQYALNPDDKFELVYVEVFNPETGKTYIFDNRQRQSLSSLTMDTDFVPLEIIQKSNMEETALMNIKEDIFNMAKQENLLSDKTHIFVKTGVENAVDADGKKIINYNVDFTYEVEEEFSARDDFKPGRYHVEESNAAMIMLQIMTKAFEQDFAKYMVEGKQVKIKVKGSADASPINRALAYDGSYGEFDSEPVYLNNELSNVSLSKKEGIATNEQLAFARALGVQQYIEKEISAFGSMKRDYEYHIEVSKEAGSQFRRISVQYTFINAF